VILDIILRALRVIVAFCVAAFVALAVLFALGSMWVGDELRAAAPPNDPFMSHGGATLYGIALFASTVTPALTALPGLVAVVVGEVLRLRSWIYYVLCGGAALVAIPILAGASTSNQSAVPAGEYMTIFAAAGFAGGFIYWLLAGARA
jgi:hypothetical protein